MNKNPRQRIEELRKLITEHDYNYYIQTNPVISDLEYDQLYAELQELENENPQLITPDSPTQRVGSDLSNDFNSTLDSNVKSFEYL